MRAVLFDLDGVLVQTEALKARAHVAATARFGGTAEEALYVEMLGQSMEVVSRAFIERAGLRVALPRYIEAFGDSYQGLLRAGVEAMPGAAALLRVLDATGWQRAVVTSSTREVLHTVLSGAGLPSFGVEICAEDVTRHKPAPDPYLHGVRALGCGTGRAVAVEDTAAGVTSAVTAGLPVIAVRHDFNRAQDLSQASVCVADLTNTGAVMACFDGLIGGAA